MKSIHYLDCNDDFMGIYNIYVQILKIMHFIYIYIYMYFTVCQLYLNNAV